MIVRLSEVTKTYRKGVKALDDLSYEVREGEIFGLLGPNGSGKTTSINCLLGLLKFESGTIEIFDQPMGPDRYDLKAQIGVIPQNVAVFYELTVEENIGFVMELQGADKEQRIARTAELLELIGMKDRAGSRPSTLSGGQKQRVAVARALASKPLFILADEPTANLDTEAAETLLNTMLLLNEKEKITFLFSTHDPRVMNKARRLISLEDGRITKDEGYVR